MRRRRNSRWEGLELEGEEEERELKDHEEERELKNHEEQLDDGGPG